MEEQGRLFRENPEDPQLLAHAKMLFEVEKAKDKKDGSVIIILATVAPLHPLRLQRLAKRAMVGLARVGEQGHNPSGDIFLAFLTAFLTASEIPVQRVTTQERNVDLWNPSTLSIEYVDGQTINSLFESAAEAVEEIILNALGMAETMTGHQKRTVTALPLDRVKHFMERYL